MNEKFCGSFYRLLKIFCVNLAFIMLMNIATQAENELKDYINRDEPVYSYELKEVQKEKEIEIHYLLLTSQTWQDIVWNHQLTILVPEKPNDLEHALLFITGGSNKDGEPKWSKANEDVLKIFGSIAIKSGCPVAVINQVPNQPLYGGKVEDEIIAYSFEKFLETEDPTWPLLFPMTKSAIKAMDAIQSYSQEKLNQTINHFVVSGGSKRGWTTWLTGASDPRVKAIGPMVIDTLNMGPQMEYQLEVWGKYSHQINDYTKLDLPNKIKEPEGQKLTNLVDPYAYRDQLEIPKLIFIGTNDQYWPVDAVKFYFDELSGPKYIHYVPNAGHDLGGGEQAGRALGAFFALNAKGDQLPKLEWEANEQEGKAEIVVATNDSIQEVNLWTVASSDRDFRDDKWSKLAISSKQSPKFKAFVSFPESGYKAFYMECVYPSPLGKTYSMSTRIYVMDSKGIVDEKVDK